MRKTLAILLLAGTTFLTGCGDSADFVETMGQQGNAGAVIVTAPVCADDNYNTNTNQTLTVNAATGVLANDVLNGGTITAFDATSTQGGTVVLNLDGGFTYAPATGFSGSDSFTYTVTNGLGAATCTVNITVVTVNGFFVDAANGDDGTGSFNGGNPFATIQEALNAAPAGSDIVVRAGNYTGTVTLDNGDRLLGEGSVLAQGTAVRPTLTGPVVLADGCTVDFVRVAGTTGSAIDAMGQNGGIVTNCEIANLTNNGDGVCAEEVSGTWNISGNTITNADDIAIHLTTVSADSATATINSNTITGSGLVAIGFTSQSTSQLTAQVHDNILTGNAVGATFECFAFSTAQVCLDIENNTNDDVYEFTRTSTATLEVEEFATPTFAGNTGTAFELLEPVTVANDGDCGF